MSGLSGKTILVTRAEHQSGDAIGAIERLGGKAVVFPTIAIAEPESWEELDRLAAGLSGYDGLIFTSSNAAEFFFKRMEATGASGIRTAAKAVFAVGEMTRRCVERHGLRVTAMPPRFTAADLASAIGRGNIRGMVFLFPHGNLTDDSLSRTLGALGARVAGVTVYRTLPPRRADVDKVQELLVNGKVDFITFTSPSTVQNFFSLFSGGVRTKIIAATRFAVIGPVTAGALRRAGVEPAVVSGRSTAEALIEAVAGYCAEKPDMTQ